MEKEPTYDKEPSEMNKTEQEAYVQEAEPDSFQRGLRAGEVQSESDKTVYRAGEPSSPTTFGQ